MSDGDGQQAGTDGQPPVLEVTDLRAGYGEVDVLKGVSVRVPRGGIVSIVGPNGAGKSTLLKAVYGLLRPREGTVLLRTRGGEHDVTGRPPYRVTAMGANYVPQVDNVFPNMTVLENLEVGAHQRQQGVRGQLERVYGWFPVLADRRRQRAATLSGGQRQMLALGRAMMTEPELLLLDEPSAGLAPHAVDEVFDKLAELNDAGITLAIVEQNARRSLAMSTYGYVLDMGTNSHEGSGHGLLARDDIVELYLGGRVRREV